MLLPHPSTISRNLQPQYTVEHVSAVLDEADVRRSDEHEKFQLAPTGEYLDVTACLSTSTTRVKPRICRRPERRREEGFKERRHH